MRKLAAGETDVLVLAAAGLDRLGRRREAGGALAGEVFVPAPGQGAITVQARTGSAAAAAASIASHDRTMACISAERAAVRELSASCHTPVGIHADFVTDGLRIRGFAGMPDGSEWIADEVIVSGEPAAAGTELARRMLAAGAAELLLDAEAMATRENLPR
jgi:hydroxymethylbilane synthase